MKIYQKTTSFLYSIYNKKKKHLSICNTMLFFCFGVHFSSSTTLPLPAGAAVDSGSRGMTWDSASFPLLPPTTIFGPNHRTMSLSAISMQCLKGVRSEHLSRIPKRSVLSFPNTRRIRRIPWTCMLPIKCTISGSLTIFEHTSPREVASTIRNLNSNKNLVTTQFRTKSSKTSLIDT